MRRGCRVKSTARVRGSAALVSSRPNTVVYLRMTSSDAQIQNKFSLSVEITSTLQSETHLPNSASGRFCGGRHGDMLSWGTPGVMLTA